MWVGFTIISGKKKGHMSRALLLPSIMLQPRGYSPIGPRSYPNKKSVRFALLCRPLHLAGVEIIVALDYPDLGSELAELGLAPNLGRNLRIIFMNSIR